MLTLFVLTSVTYAVKGQAILKNIGIRSSLTKQSELKHNADCGYGLKVASESAEAAENALTSAGIKILSRREVGKP